MNSRQTARFKAYSLALAYLQENEQTTNAVPIFAAVHTSAMATLNAISNTNKRKIENRKGVADNKQQHQDSLSAQAQSIASVIGTYATLKKDLVLKEAMNFKKKELFYGADQLLNEKSANILTKAKELAADLKDYGITPALIASFESQLKDYSITINEPRNVAMERKQAVMQIKDLFIQLKLVFTEQLDPLMQLLKADNRDFYDQYLLKRTIVDPAHRTTKVEGTVTDKLTRKALTGVTVMVKATDFIVSTFEDGRYSLNVPGVKQVPVTYQKEGYKPVTLQATLKKGQSTTLDVELEEA
jgi:hypothetical protein